MRDADNADKDLRKAASLAPGDVAIRKELQKVAAERKRQNQKQAKAVAGIFDQVDLYDDKEGLKRPKTEEETPEAASTADKSDSTKPQAEAAPAPAAAVDDSTAASTAAVDSEGQFTDLGRPD